MYDESQASRSIESDQESDGTDVSETRHKEDWVHQHKREIVKAFKKYPLHVTKPAKKTSASLQKVIMQVYKQHKNIAMVQHADLSWLRNLKFDLDMDLEEVMQ